MLDNAEALPIIRSHQSNTLSLSNGFANFSFANFPENLQLPYSNATSVSISSAYESCSPIVLVFQRPGSALTATAGWRAGSVPAIQTAGVLDLTLFAPVVFRYLDDSAFAVSPETLANMEFSTIRTASVTVTSAMTIVGFMFDATDIVVQNVTSVDRSSFIGPLTFDLNRPGFNFQAVLGSGIPPNIIFNLSDHVSLTFDQAFSHAISLNSITIIGRDATVYYQGDSLPPCLNITGAGIAVIQVPLPTLTPSSSPLIGAKIAALVVVSTVFVGVVIFTIFVVCRHHKAVLDYDKFPDADDLDVPQQTSCVNL
jgi:hypothetical protein